MKRTRGVVVGLLAVALAACIAVATGAAAETASRVAFERVTDVHNYGNVVPGVLDSSRQVKVILELEGDSVGRRNAAAKARGRELSQSEQASIRSELRGRQSGVQGKVRELGGQVLASYQDAYNGVAVRVPVVQLGPLAATADVRAVHPVRTYKLENTRGAAYIGAPAAWGDLGLTGVGVKVAVIDTGVDYWHADFGGSGDPADFESNDGTVVEQGTFPTAKVVAGYDFVGDEYDSSSDDPAIATPQPDPDPVDCNGHGTHVAGTSAGLGVLDDGSTFAGPYNATTLSGTAFRVGPGVAPEALILAYRVFGCEGSASSDVIVAALERAYEDGADVVNMSLGSPFGLTSEPDAVASNTLSDNGVVVVASAGNEGPNAYITGSPGVASKALSVAALDASGASFSGGLLNGGTISSLQLINANDGPLPVTGPLKVLKNADGTVSLGCDAAEYAGTAGTIAVTLRGTCARADRAIFGDAAGAKAVIMINNAAGLPPFEGQIPGVDIPFLGAASSATAALVANDGATVTVAATTVANPGWQRTATFSSGGPRIGDSAAKPEVTAPGVSIVSAGVGSGAGPATISGTSMSSPLTAGVAALVNEAHPDWSSEWIKAAIVNTADVSSKIIGYNPRLNGTGVVDARRATDTTGLATANEGLGSLSYGYEPLGGAYTETQKLTLVNTGSQPVTYNLSAAFSGSSLGFGVTISPSSVTVPAIKGNTQTVDVTLSLSAAGVAALPPAETSNFGALVTARGALVATPTTSGTGVYPLRVVFLVAPRGLSNITAADKGPRPAGKGQFVQKVELGNSGIHAGNADVYQWGVADASDSPAFDGSGDVRAIGVQSLPGELFGAPGDIGVVFAVNMHGSWSNPSTVEVDIPIDTNGDGTPDFFVIGFDLGAILAGNFNGQYASFIFDADGNLVDAWVATGPMNGSTMLLPALAKADLGLADGASFSYSAATFSIYDGSLLDETRGSEFNPFGNAIETGGFFALPPGARGTVEFRYDRAQMAREKALGLMFVGLDDQNGAAQADLIGIGSRRFG